MLSEHTLFSFSCQDSTLVGVQLMGLCACQCCGI